MKEIFISFLNVGINGSILIAAVILTRLIFKKYNRSIICLLWGLVALRMLIPLNIPAEFSLLPRAQSVTVEKAETDTPVTDTQPDKAPVADNGINVGGNNRVPITDTDINAGGNNGAPVTEGAVGGDVQPPVSVTPDEGVPEVPPVSNVATSNEVDTAEAHPDVKDIFIRYGTVVWLVGIACMVIYYVICDIRLRIKTRVRYEKEKGVYLCDDVKSPFVMGVIRPRIMLPSSTDEENEQYILLHERAHIERGDHIWKVLAFAVLALHWYNPFVWLSFMLYSRDTELACDERVIRKNGSEIRKPYAHALLTYSMGKGGYVRGGWSFSQRSLTARIKGVLNYKKPALWVFVSFGLACIVLAVCFMTVPVEGEDGDGGDTQVSATEGTTETETAESTEPTENTEVTENTEPTENTETTDSTEPEPTEPEPTEPESTEPEPTESEPTEPEPTEPEPTEPEPTESDPTEPKPTESESTEPEPTEPEPTEPEPTEPEPTEPKPDEKEPTTVFNTMARDSFIEGEEIDLTTLSFDIFRSSTYCGELPGGCFKKCSGPIVNSVTEHTEFTIYVSISTSLAELRYNLKEKEIAGMDIDSLPFDWVPLIDHYRFEKYTDEFFEENAVIVLIDTLGSGTCRHEVFDTTYNGGDLCFGMRKLCEDEPGKAYTLLDTRWITVVEIPKSFLANINTVSIYTERLDPFLSN